MAVTCSLDPLQELLGDDLIGSHINSITGSDQSFDSDEWLHDVNCRTIGEYL